jgi:hypothetical protein
MKNKICNEAKMSLNNELIHRPKIPWLLFSKENLEQIYKYYMKYVKSGGNELYRYSKVQNTVLDFYYMTDVDMDYFEELLAEVNKR